MQWISAIPTVDTIDPEEEVKEVTVGVAKNEEVEDILLDSLAKDKEAAEAVEKAGVSVNVAVEVDKIDEKSPFFGEAKAFLEKLSAFEKISPDFLPKDSLLREFVGWFLYIRGI